MRRALKLAGVLVLVIVIAGAGGAAACKYTELDCGIAGSQTAAGNTELPDGFRQDVIASGLNAPTDLAFLPDGNLLVSEKEGIVKLIDTRNRVRREPYLDIRSRVNTAYLRGLLSIQVDPDFERNGYLYALYVREEEGKKPVAPRTMRLSRFTVENGTASADSEKVIVGADGVGSCMDLRKGADCIPSDNTHNGGDIEFRRDGTMFVSTGDGGGADKFEVQAFNSPDLDSLGGKLLHITRDGRGVRDNPFWDGDPRSNRSRLWAYGLRNPWRIALHPETDFPYVGDVGWRDIEEIDAVKRGSNNGWPCYEGRARQAVYGKTDFCKRVYKRGPGIVENPIVEYSHEVGTSVTLGSFITGSLYPEQYRGMLAYGDVYGGFMNVMRVDGKGNLTRKPEQFADKTGLPVMIATGPEGKLYYLAYERAELRRIDVEGN